MMVTSWPALTSLASVPPQPLSGSSGWPPTQTIFFLVAILGGLALNNPGRVITPRPAAAVFTKLRRELFESILGENLLTIQARFTPRPALSRGVLRRRGQGEAFLPGL